MKLQVNEFLGELLFQKASDLYRYKGLLAIHNIPERFVFQVLNNMHNQAQCVLLLHSTFRKPSPREQRYLPACAMFVGHHYCLQESSFKSWLLPRCRVCTSSLMAGRPSRGRPGRRVCPRLYSSARTWMRVSSARASRTALSSEGLDCACCKILLLAISVADERRLPSQQLHMQWCVGTIGHIILGAGTAGRILPPDLQNFKLKS